MSAHVSTCLADSQAPIGGYRGPFSIYDWGSFQSVTEIVIHPRSKVSVQATYKNYDDVIKWKKFPRYWPFMRGIHRSPVDSPYKGQWRGALMFTLICARINGWVNNREAGDLRRYRPHYDVIVMMSIVSHTPLLISNDCMEIMLQRWILLKMTYRAMSSMKVCFCK